MIEQTMTAGQKAWATRRARLVLLEAQISKVEIAGETLEERRQRWEAEMLASDKAAIKEAEQAAQQAQERSRTEAEALGAQRPEWQTAFDKRCEVVGAPKPGSDWDPEAWRAGGYDAMADHILQTWGTKWEPRGWRQWLREQAFGQKHSAKKAADKRKGGMGRRAWKFA